MCPIVIAALSWAKDDQNGSWEFWRTKIVVVSKHQYASMKAYQRKLTEAGSQPTVKTVHKSDNNFKSFLPKLYR